MKITLNCETVLIYSNDIRCKALIIILTLYLQEAIHLLGGVAVKGITPNRSKTVFSGTELQRLCGIRCLDLANSSGIVYDKGQNRQQFASKSVQDFFAGRHLANHPAELSTYLQDVHSVQDVFKLDNIWKFAASSKRAAREILTKLVDVFESQLKRFQFLDRHLSFDEIKIYQEFIELCLEINFEADAQGEFSPILKPLFRDGVVKFYGIPSKSATCLAYLMNHCDDRNFIRDIKIYPIAHPDDPVFFFKPASEMYRRALQSMKRLSTESIHEMRRKFIAANPDMHNDWKRRTPEQLVAYMKCFEACEGLPSSRETNILPIFRRVKHVNLERLNISYIKIGDSFDILHEAIQDDNMKSLLKLFIRETGVKPKQMTELAKSLPKLPALQMLDISSNHVEPEKSIPLLAENLKYLPDLKMLYLNDLEAPADDMAKLAERLPQQLTDLTINDNDMNDKAASILVRTLPTTLTSLDISTYDLSESKHDELLNSLHDRLKDIERLHIDDSPYPANLMKHGGLALQTCEHLNYLILDSMSKSVVPEKALDIFMDGLEKANNIERLALYGIDLSDEGFDRLMRTARSKNLKQLR